MDKGPWSLYHDQKGILVGVISEDFEHDVVLRVSGDFTDHAERLSYCEWLARKLNTPDAATTEGGDDE